MVTDYQQLRQVSEKASKEEADSIYGKLQNIVSTHDSAVGLSAIQIGIPKRVFIALIGEEWELFVNPEIVEQEADIIEGTEGCLSFPGYEVATRRSRQITVTADNLESKLVLTDFDAVVFQHELDHLNGVLFFDRGYIVKSPLTRNSLCFCGSGKKFKRCHG